jgi:hypothetical protein
LNFNFPYKSTSYKKSLFWMDLQVVDLKRDFFKFGIAEAMINDARQVVPDEKIEITLGADKGYDAKEFIDACIELKVTPHVAQNTSGRSSAVPDEIAQTAGYAVSQQKRKLIEQGFGWAKTVGPIRQLMVRGLERVDQLFVLTMAAYNLTRMRTLGQMRLPGQ